MPALLLVELLAVVLSFLRCQSDLYTVPDPGSIFDRKFSRGSSVASCGTVHVTHNTPSKRTGNWGSDVEMFEILPRK